MSTIPINRSNKILNNTVPQKVTEPQAVSDSLDNILIEELIKVTEEVHHHNVFLTAIDFVSTVTKKSRIFYNSLLKNTNWYA